MASPAIRVLLVEDHEHVIWGLGKLIEGEAPRMVLAGAARTVAEAERLLDTGGTDVVVLDVFVGEENTLDRLPARIAASGAAMLVLTGSRDPELRSRAMESGAHGFVLKDDPADDLLQEIERAHRERKRS
jgi:two-component system, NarL family, nitrate/nitrite response regulator NarL